MPKIERLVNVGFAAREAKAIASGYTGEVRFGFWDNTSSAPEGWLWLNGDTIGPPASGATHVSNIYEALFYHLWTILNDTYAPLLTSAGAGSTRGATWLADWLADKRLTLPNSAGKMLICKAASGTASVLGENGGAITHTHNTKAHYHGMGTGADLSVDINHDHAAFNAVIATQIIAGGTDTAKHAFGDLGGSAYNVNASINVPALGATAKTPTGRVGLVTGGVDGNDAQATTDNSAAAPYIVYVGMIAI